VRRPDQGGIPGFEPVDGDAGGELDQRPGGGERQRRREQARAESIRPRDQARRPDRSQGERAGVEERDRPAALRGDRQDPEREERGQGRRREADQAWGRVWRGDAAGIAGLETRRRRGRLPNG